MYLSNINVYGLSCLLPVSSLTNLSLPDAVFSLTIDSNNLKISLLELYSVFTLWVLYIILESKWQFMANPYQTWQSFNCSIFLHLAAGKVKDTKCKGCSATHVVSLEILKHQNDHTYPIHSCFDKQLSLSGQSLYDEQLYKNFNYSENMNQKTNWHKHWTKQTVLKDTLKTCKA